MAQKLCNDIPPDVVPETVGPCGSREYVTRQGHLEARAGGCQWGKEVGVQGGKRVM